MAKMTGRSTEVGSVDVGRLEAATAGGVKQLHRREERAPSSSLGDVSGATGEGLVHVFHALPRAHHHSS